MSLGHKIEKSFLYTVVGICFLFSFAIAIVLIAPTFLDSSWTQSCSTYQCQMYEIADPNHYYGSLTDDRVTVHSVRHIKKGMTLLAFKESESLRIIAPPSLEHYITYLGDSQLKLTSDLLLLREPQKSASFDALSVAKHLKKEGVTILELYQPDGEEAFVIASADSVTEDFVQKNFIIIDDEIKAPYHKESGVLYVHNPRPYRVSIYSLEGKTHIVYDPKGELIESVEQLTTPPFGFKSRKELIAYGEHIYAIEGCWYCHTDQTRTLVQDVVLNGSDSYPAPPSSASEYIFEKITFPGTRRIGPDLSRVGVKRPQRDWHRGHFKDPKTASKGTIMPAFKHFFDDVPSGTQQRVSGLSDEQFEAVYQYLMTKGTRITAPEEAWWLGKDPVNTKAIIESKND